MSLLTMTSPILQPPPFTDFEYVPFDPALSAIFPNAPALPSSAELFSPTETNDLLGFLDNFGELSWDIAPDYLLNEQHNVEQPTSHLYTPYSNPHLNTNPSSRPKAPARSSSSRNAYQSPTLPSDEPGYFDSSRDASQSRSSPSDAATSPTFETSPQHTQPPPSQRSSSIGPRSGKSLLSTPQKRYVMLALNRSTLYNGPDRPAP